jgi:hypothetical protein
MDASGMKGTGNLRVRFKNANAQKIMIFIDHYTDWHGQLEKVSSEIKFMTPAELNEEFRTKTLKILSKGVVVKTNTLNDRKIYPISLNSLIKGNLLFKREDLNALTFSVSNEFSQLNCNPSYL